jgi:hypothetical protein
MTSLRRRTLAVAAITLCRRRGQAQESTNRVATMTDWNVFTEESPKECWGVSKPKETVNSRDGQPVRCGAATSCCSSPSAPASPARSALPAAIPLRRLDRRSERRRQAFQLFTDGEWAWPGSAEDDAALLAALKAGTTAVLTREVGQGHPDQGHLLAARLYRRDGRRRQALPVRPPARMTKAPPWRGAFRFSRRPYIRAISRSPVTRPQ